MRKVAIIAALATATLSGCAVLETKSAPPEPSPPSSAAPTAPPPQSAQPDTRRLTVADAAKAAESWITTHNTTIKDRDWWDDPALIDELFWAATRHEAILDRGHVEDGKKHKARKPIRLTGGQTYYVPREQPPDGEWFIVQARYRGQDRDHLLAFWRPARSPSFKLASKTPVHYGELMPKPVVDAEGYVTAAPALTGMAVSQEYRKFWNEESRKKAAGNGYRLAKDNYSREAYAVVSKGLYAAFDSTTQEYGFRTEDGGSFFMFSLLNKPKYIFQVLTVGVAVKGGGKAIYEIAGDWYA
ncbi:hypothetical protein SAMN05421505_15026 [Sinosporangium album]|uniref:DUF8094 domain-containing protein n=1 Tax=Sinosporangium album TaxID=504805 RepID=A0A1G8KG13_9ACTN|nr:hypothetical protein [Sinosporangium album]SDI42335.1 hypothetical protein SAMN05421505_15026 [Sinosporangium album]